MENSPSSALTSKELGTTIDGPFRSERHPDSYRKSLLAALKNNHLNLARSLVYRFSCVYHLDSVITDILLTAVREEQSYVVQRLTMMYLVISPDLVKRIKANIAFSVWDLISSLIQSGVPAEVADHLAMTCSKYQLISLFAMEVSICPVNRDWLQQNAWKIVFCKLVCGGYRCQNIAANIISGISSSTTSGEPLPEKALTGLSRVYKLFDQSKHDLCKMNAETLKKFSKCLDQSRSHACHSFAVLLAASQHQWNYVMEAIRGKRVVLHTRLKDIFNMALKDQAWCCAAVILDSLIRAGPQHSGELDAIEISIRLGRRCAWLPEHEYMLFPIKPFLSACWKLHLPAAGAMVAALHNKVTSVQRFMAQPMDQKTLKWLLEMMLRGSRSWTWVLALHILKTHPDQELASTVLKRASELSSTVRCRCVVTQLLNAVREESTAQTVLYNIINNKQLQLLQLCLAKNVHKLAKYRSLNFPSILHQVIRCMAGIPVMVNSTFAMMVTSVTEHQEDCKLLKQCVEAGLTTLATSQTPLSVCSDRVVDVSPLQMLIHSNLFDTIRLLHYTGAVSNHDLFSITSNTSVITHLETRGLHAELSYLQNAASSIRSLKDLSSLCVSRFIGCDADRKHRALRLPLPMSLINKVLFFDVLYDSELSASTSLDYKIVYRFQLGTLCNGEHIFKPIPYSQQVSLTPSLPW